MNDKGIESRTFLYLENFEDGIDPESMGRQSVDSLRRQRDDLTVGKLPAGVCDRALKRCLLCRGSDAGIQCATAFILRRAGAPPAPP